MEVKKTYKYKMPDWIRESFSEFLGNFLQLYLLLVALILRYVMPSSTIRKYTDPDYCQPGNGTDYHCDMPNIPMGKKENQNMYTIEFNALYVLVIALIWSGSLVLSLLVTVPVSGGYLNPAISVTLATMSRLQWKKLYHYIPAQYLGSFFAALCFHVVYQKHTVDRDDIILFVLVSTPHPKINMWTAMADSFFGSAIFSLFLFAIIDKRRVPHYVQPLLLAFVLFGIVLGFYADTKIQLSPARDLGTRLYAAFVTDFERAFSSFSYCFWWLPKQICLYVGFLAGGWLYVGFFGKDNNEEMPTHNNNIEETNLNSNENIDPKQRSKLTKS